jgi:hypothetical protein
MGMRVSIAALALCSLAAPASLAAQTSAGATVTASFAPRSTVSASSQVLVFDVSDPSTPAIATLDFVAAARTAPGGEVRLMAEVDSVPGEAGPAGPEALIFLEGGPDGTIAGTVDPAAPALAARWTGSGRRGGRLVFSLRAPSPGTYAIPVKLSVSVR